MAPRGMTGHTGFREQIKKKKNHGQIAYKKHIEENNGLLSLFFLKKLRIYLWKLARKVRVTTKSIFFKCYLFFGA